MTLLRIAAAALVSASLALPAFAADDASDFALTAALIKKLEAAEPELNQLEPLDDEDELDDESPAATVRRLQRLAEAHPGARAILARHGMTSRQYALTVVAVTHAGLYLTVEGLLDKKEAAKRYASFTPQQRANIDLVRKTGTARKR